MFFNFFYDFDILILLKIIYIYIYILIYFQEKNILFFKKIPHHNFKHVLTLPMIHNDLRLQNGFSHATGALVQRWQL